MRCEAMEKKLIHHESGKSCFSKKETGSKRSSSLHSKTGCKISYTKRCKPKPKSHVKTIGSILSKRRVSEFSRNGTRNNSMSGKSIRRITIRKALDSNSSEKRCPSRLLCEKSSLVNCKEHEDIDYGDVRTHKEDKKRKRKRRKEKMEKDEASCLQRKTRYLMIKMKLEQNLIDAYSGEGWKGQSREKIKPEKELQRAKKQILKCQLGIRDAIHHLESLSSDGCIEDSVIAADGSVYHEHIFCAKCKLRDAFPDNDIILCDGTCNCGFHQKCLEPPLATENIPPGDQGWFCKFCECKIEIFEALNAHLGTNFSANNNWQDVFKEAAMLSDVNSASFNPEEDWPSDDSEDDDYDPERNESSSSSHSRIGTEDDVSDDASCSSGLLWSLGEDSLISGGSENYHSVGGTSQGKRRRGIDNLNADSINSIDSSDADIISGRRQRKDVDYKKLHDEMFGKDTPENEHVSEDEDWGPRRRKRRQKESDAASTLMTLCENESECAHAVPVSEKKKIPLVSQSKKRLFRIPPNAVEKLRQVFAENELPSKAVRDGLSKQLGVASEKVNKWFKNARYTALRIRKAALQGENRKQHHGSASILKQSSAELGKNQSVIRLPSKLLPSATRVCIPKNMNKVHRRKNSKSIITPSKKTQLKRATGAISCNIDEKFREAPTENQSPSVSEKRIRSKQQGSSYDQVSMEFSSDVSLKKLFNDLKGKSTRGKKVNSNCKVGTSSINETKNKEQLYLVEMERLCHLKDKVDKLKNVLLRMYSDENNVSYKTHDPLVIYVPIAEVKEKV